MSHIITEDLIRAAKLINRYAKDVNNVSRRKSIIPSRPIAKKLLTYAPIAGLKADPVHSYNKKFLEANEKCLEEYKELGDLNDNLYRAIISLAKYYHHNKIIGIKSMRILAETYNSIYNNTPDEATSYQIRAKKTPGVRQLTTPEGFLSFSPPKWILNAILNTRKPNSPIVGEHVQCTTLNLDPNLPKTFSWIMVNSGISRDITGNKIFGVDLREFPTLGKINYLNIVGLVNVNLVEVYQRISWFNNVLNLQVPGIREIVIYGGNIPGFIYGQPPTYAEYVIALDYGNQPQSNFIDDVFHVMKIICATQIFLEITDTCIKCCIENNQEATVISIVAVNNYVEVFKTLPAPQQICLRKYSVEITPVSYIYFRYGICIVEENLTSPVMDSHYFAEIIRRGHPIILPGLSRFGELPLKVFGVTLVGTIEDNIILHPEIMNICDNLEEPKLMNFNEGRVIDYIKNREWYLPYHLNVLAKDPDNNNKMSAHYSPEHLISIYEISRGIVEATEENIRKFNEIMDIEKEKLIRKNICQIN